MTGADELIERLPQDARQKVERADMPDWLEPMLATLTHDYFSDPNWIFERKLDGERCLAYRQGDQVRLMSRNQKSLNGHYPEVADALAASGPERYILDGEIVAFEGNVTSFAKLSAARMHIEDPEEARASGVPVYYYVFDIPFLDGYDLREVPLRRRKALLKAALGFQGPIRYLEHRNEEGVAYHKEACSKGWEGVIAKDASSTYVGARSRSWLKFKCANNQELVIGGYTDPHGSRIGFGALLLGYYQGEDLIYAGKVGTGFDDETLKRLYERLSSIQRAAPPYTGDQDLPLKEVHWVSPELVAEIGFTEWTRDGRLRHPRFQGLREDKAAREVVREEPSDA